MYHDINRDIDLTPEQLDEALAFDDERRRDQKFEWAMHEVTSVRAAVTGGAKLRVVRIEEGFEIVLRLKYAEKSQIVLRSRLNNGGLFTIDGSVIFYPYEFSMQKYQHHMNMRAATEYVRRKFSNFAVLSA